jgi:ribosomal protein S27E
MPHEAVCPKGHRLQVTEAHFGERVSCPTCGEAFTVPEGGSRPASGSASHFATIKPSGDSQQWKSSLGAMSGMMTAPLVMARPLVAIGLILVLCSRGCDEIGRRSVDRAKMKITLAKDQFEDKWLATKADLEAQIADLKTHDLKPGEQKHLEDLQKDLADMPGLQEKERKKAEAGAWRTLDSNARSALTSYQIDGYWRQIFFVFASIVLASGLLVVGWSADGAERWISLVMLAIITFSVYIGGLAWMTMK